MKMGFTRWWQGRGVPLESRTPDGPPLASIPTALADVSGEVSTAVLSEKWTIPITRERANCVLPQSFAAFEETRVLRRLPQVAREDILSAWGQDPWLCNYFVNLWEYLKGEDTLISYPYNITIPIADVCNARCTFCTSWLEGTKVLALEDVEKFADILRYARVVGLAGHGEPLAHPNCEDLFARISSHLDHRCQAYLITNGVFLQKQRSALDKINITTYNISLNSTTPRTHDVVMGLGPDAFGTVMASVRELISRRNNEQPQMEINISLVINRDNVHELADFVAMGNELGVNKIYLRTLNAQNSIPVGLNYHRLPPYLHPKFDDYVNAAKAEIAKSKSQIITDVRSWSTPVFSAPVEELIAISPPPESDRREALKDKDVRRFYSNYYESRQDIRGMGEPIESSLDPMEDGTNPYGRSPQFHCTYPYQDFIINDFNLRLIPCCYMADVPGFDTVRYDGSRPFFEYWNSPAFRALRKSLRGGPLYGACKKCPAQTPPPAPDDARISELDQMIAVGSFSTLFDARGRDLCQRLEKILYGQIGLQDAVTETSEGIFFRRTDARDHLTTPFLEVSPGGGWIRIRFEHPRPSLSEGCVFTLQDETYNMLPAIVREPAHPLGSSSVVCMALPENVRRVRLTLNALNDNPVILPHRLMIEEAVNQRPGNV